MVEFLREYGIFLLIGIGGMIAFLVLTINIEKDKHKRKRGKK